MELGSAIWRERNDGAADPSADALRSDRAWIAFGSRVDRVLDRVWIAFGSRLDRVWIPSSCFGSLPCFEVASKLRDPISQKIR